MKTLNQLLSEALNDEQKAKVDTWHKGKGHTFSDHVFGGKDGHTVYEPFNESKTAAPHPKVAEHLEKHGYKMHDYVKGYATDKHGRQVSIGKVLHKTKAAPEVKKAFETDPARQSSQKSNLLIAYSRHPHHVAGMSTGTGWESCMHFERGIYSSRLQDDVREGTHVAYLIHGNDKEIKNPIARIAMKPFHAVDSAEHKVLRPEPRTYGHGGEAFTSSVRDWTEKHFPLKSKTKYKINRDVYNDGVGTTLINHDKETFDHFMEHGDHDDRQIVLKHSLHHAREALAKQPSERIARIIIRDHHELAAENVNHPNESVRRVIAYTHPTLAHHFVNDSSVAVRADAAMLKPELFLKDKDSQVREQVAATSKFAHHFLNDPSPRVQTRAWRNASEEHMLAHINAGHPVSEEHLRDAVENSKLIAGKFMNHPNELIRSSATRYPEHAKKMVNDPSPVVRAQIAAVHTGLAHHFVNDPAKEVRNMAVEHSPELFVHDPAHEIRAKVAAYSSRGFVKEHMSGETHPEVKKMILFNHPLMAHRYLSDTNKEVADMATRQHARNIRDFGNQYHKLPSV